MAWCRRAGPQKSQMSGKALCSHRLSKPLWLPHDQEKGDNVPVKYEEGFSVRYRRLQGPAAERAAMMKKLDKPLIEMRWAAVTTLQTTLGLGNHTLRVTSPHSDWTSMIRQSRPLVAE